MKLVEIIEQKSSSCDEYKTLWSVAGSIKNQGTIEHLKLISSQMSEYDIHDERHSEKVIDIIEKILGDKLETLSFYELVLLYLAAYLHDSGMALPKWEYEALMAVEGCDEHSDSTLKFSIKNDFKPPQSFDEVKKIIESNNLFNYEQAENYIFIEDSQEKVIKTIANLIIDYEHFRNRYSAKLKEKTTTPDYIEFSKVIRSEFIRQKHHKKAANNIENLSTKNKEEIEKAMGPAFATKFIEDLKDICQAHGENLDFINNLPSADKLDRNGSKNNIQFLAEMLRLGDIIHFSSDRAPLSLFSEKLITNEESLRHWKAKFGVGYSILPDDKNQIQIAFDARFTEPQTYYFFVDYIKEIETEISNFNSLKQHWEGVYNSVDLNPNVDMKCIMYENFIPTNMKFTMDQSKILDLLGGVQLYEDKFACLREVYQNALDTSKCLLAYNEKRNVHEKINIEFGIGEEFLEGRNRKYIYCLDHGLGMNEEIIKKYFLHIGNSYYKSEDFYEKWNLDVKPTSQFGIGILSCYMIADKIGITTTYYEDKKTTSFILSGISERFYYKDPENENYRNKIGEHGTIVKLYLKDEYADNINSDFIPKMPLFLDAGTEVKEADVEEIIAMFDKVERVKNNLFYILFQYIGVQHSKISVVIRTPEEKTEPLYHYNQVLDYRNYKEITKNDIEKTIEYTYNNVKKFINRNMLAPLDVFFDNILLEHKIMRSYIVKTETDNVTLYTLLSLPKKGADKVLFEAHFIGKKYEEYLCVDGISVERSDDISDDIDEYLGFYKGCLYNTLINFTGTNRPVLSVNRTKCVEFAPKFSDEESNQLKEEFLSKMLEQIKSHMTSEGIDFKDKESFLIYDSVLHYTNLTVALKLLMKTYLTLADDLFVPDECLSYLRIRDIDLNQKITIKNVDFRKYKKIPKQLIYERCIYSESIGISDDSLIISNSSRDMHDVILSPNYNIPSHFRCVISADEWKGKYEEYDLVTSLWPIVNPNLFNKLSWKSDNPHCKTNCSRIIIDGSIETIVELDPNRDIYPHNNDIIIIRDRRIEENFMLEELLDYAEDEQNEKKHPTLFVYITPKNLDSLEESDSEYTKEKEYPEYLNGVKNGWSIYFLSGKGYIIRSGIHSRKEMENLIREKYKEQTEGITYIDMNGKIVVEGKKQSPTNAPTQ